MDQMAALSSLYGVQLASYVKHASPQNTLRTFSMRWVTHAYVLYRVSQRLKGKPELRPAEIPPLHERVTPWQNEVDYFLAPRYNAERLARFASWGLPVPPGHREDILEWIALCRELGFIRPGDPAGEATTNAL